MKFWIYKHDWNSSEKIFSDLALNEEVSYYGKLFRFQKLKYFFLNSYNNNRKKFNLSKIFFVLPEKKDEDYCFIFFGGMNIVLSMNGAIQYIKNKYPYAKKVAYFTDVNDLNKFDISDIKSNYDAIYVFNETDAMKLGLQYFPLPTSDMVSNDIAFIGQGKGRSKELEKLALYFYDNNVTFFFYLVDNTSNVKYKSNNIWYGPPLPHSDVIKILSLTNCILELKNDSTDALTDRIQIAITYNKKILTNNHTIEKNKYYNQNLIQIYSDVNSINTDFIKKSIYEFTYNYKGEYSVSNLLNCIKSFLLK